ncbi:MAG: aminotransferase class IV [Thermodesulfobacteriota bacterium]|nr:aminotransferase class IV [Thermodesulfobacteriota bacterium]
MDTYVYINGDYVIEEKAVISVFDRGFLLGDGLFETIRTYNGRPFMLKEHIERMNNSLSHFHIPMILSPEKVNDTLKQLMKLNNLYNAYVRITVSRGIHKGSLTLDDECDPTLIITIKEYTPYPSSFYKKGITIIFSELMKHTPSPLAGHKTTSYLPYIMAREEARKRGAQEAVITDANGYVTECTTSNLFVVKEGCLFTPKSESLMLRGITRNAVLDIANRLSIWWIETDVSAHFLPHGDEVFITNSLMEVMPVAFVEDTAIGETIPGKITTKLMRGYKERIKNETTG